MDKMKRAEGVESGESKFGAVVGATRAFISVLALMGSLSTEAFAQSREKPAPRADEYRFNLPKVMGGILAAIEKNVHEWQIAEMQRAKTLGPIYESAVKELFADFGTLMTLEKKAFELENNIQGAKKLLEPNADPALISAFQRHFKMSPAELANSTTELLKQVIASKMETSKKYSDSLKKYLALLAEKDLKPFFR